MRDIIIKFTLTIYLISPSAIVLSQAFNPGSPLDIPLFLSGNFGELRSTHFHAGLDFKTNGETGYTIRSVESGYVSRIKVQAGGYGQAVYITHPNGYTSVYCHLSRFLPEMETYVRDNQYRLHSYEVDLYPPKDMFVYNKGEKVGISGNTGNSGGPHLHLEIRDQNQVPLNGLKYNFPVKDTLPPAFYSLLIYNHIDENTFTDFSKDEYKLKRSTGSFTLHTPVRINHSFGIGVEVYDFLNGSTNKCGVYSLDLLIDDDLYYSMQIDRVGFDEASYIKVHGDYYEKNYNKRSVHRLFIEPNNKLKIYKTRIRNGLVELNDTLPHHCKVIATDIYGNKSVLDFVVVSDGKTEKSEPVGEFVSHLKQSAIVEEDFEFVLPSGSLYSDKFVSSGADSSVITFLSPVYIIGDYKVPVHNYPSLSIKYKDTIAHYDNEKLLIGRIEPDGDIINEGGVYNNGQITAGVTGFGSYAIMIDSMAPDIKPLSFKENGWYAASNVLSFRITDNLSGIKTYNGYVDDKWVLFEYDAKSDLIFYTVDETRLKKTNALHTLKIFVMDERNNMQTYFSNFYF